MRAATRPARAAWVVRPRYEAGARASFAARARPGMLVDLSRNAFNLGPTGREGFLALCRLLDDCRCFDFRYARLDDAIAAFDDLAKGEPERWPA